MDSGPWVVLILPHRAVATWEVGIYMRVSVVALIAAISFSAASANLAVAADLPAQVPAYRGPALVPAPIFSWTGLYLGVHGGGAYGTDKVTEVSGSAYFPAGFVHTTNNPVGALVGGYVGVNYQINQLVIGLDGDYSALFLEGKSTSVGPGSVANVTEKIRWLGTGTGRVGVSFDSWMLYGKGGWAWAGFKTDAAIFTAGINTSIESSSQTRSGWIAGVGAEWMWMPNVLFKAEYNYIDFGSTAFNTTNTTLGAGVAVLARNADTTLHVAKFGVAYKF